MKSIAQVSRRVSALAVLFTISLLLAFASSSQALELDPAFGAGGVGGSIPLPSADPWEVVDTITRPDGSRVLLASSEKASGFALFSFAADGTPDAGFGSGGRMVLSPGKKRSFAARDLEQFADGSVAVAGVRRNRKVYRAAVVRITRSGAVDGTFGSRGVYEANTTSDPKIDTDNGVAVTVDPNQRVLLASTFHQSVVTTRLRRSGAPDRRFGKRGKSQVSFKHYLGANVKAITVQRSGAILIMNDMLLYICGGGSCPAGPSRSTRRGSFG